MNGDPEEAEEVAAAADTAFTAKIGRRYRYRWATKARKLFQRMTARGRRRPRTAHYVKLSRSNSNCGRRRSRWGFFVVRRFRVRILRGIRWDAMKKSLVKFYYGIVKDMREASPFIERLHASAMITAHFGMPAIPPSALPALDLA